MSTQKHDITLKLLLGESADETLRLLGAGGKVTRWLNVEMPTVQNRRVDLVGELDTGELLHLEMQGENDLQMAVRMLEYGVCILRREERFPRQVALYVGNDKMRMPDRIEAEGLSFRYRLIDIRDLDGAALLASDELSDNLLAVLGRLDDRMDAIRRILAKIVRLEPGKRHDAFLRLLLTCGMRGLEEEANEEWKKMAFSFRIEDNKVLGPMIRELVEKRGEKAKEEGLEQGKKELVRRLIEKRFCPLPAWAEERLNGSSPGEIEDLGLRLLDARSLEELFR